MNDELVHVLDCIDLRSHPLELADAWTNDEAAHVRVVQGREKRLLLRRKTGQRRNPVKDVVGNRKEVLVAQQRLVAIQAHGDKFTFRSLDKAHDGPDPDRQGEGNDVSSGGVEEAPLQLAQYAEGAAGPAVLSCRGK